MSLNYKVINVILNGQVTSDWLNPLEELLVKISNGSDRLAANYKIDNMKLADHLSFDLLVNNENKIISFAGVYNGGRYPEGVYRVLNRTWVDENERVSHGAFKYITSKYILPEQIKRHQDKFKLIFVSRERLSGKGFLLKWARHQPDAELWKVSDKLVQVVPHIEKQSCYQYICSREFKNNDWNPKTLSEADWLKL